MSEYKDFTSLPPEAERTFVVYEKHTVESGKQARLIGTIVAGVFGLIVCVVVFSFSAPKHNLMADDDMGLLKTSSDKGEKDEAGEKDTPDKPAEAKPAEGADSAEAEGAAAEGGEAEGAAAAEGGEAEGAAAEGGEGDSPDSE